MTLEIPDAIVAARDAGVPAHSFELFPPRNDAAAIALGRTIDRLAASEPLFFSVTFGAGGSTRDRSLTVLEYILSNTRVRPVAHLTAVGSSVDEAAQRVREFLAAGISDFLALRGDPPAGGSDDVGAFGGGADLVRLIGEVAAEVRAGGASSRPADAAAQATGRPVVAVAAFPSGHPRQTSRWSDVDALLAKQDAGAGYAITQAFFRPEDYLEYVERARRAGVTIPILPGIAPVTNERRLVRLAELSDQAPPADLLGAFESASDPAEAAEAGIRFAADLAAAAVAGGAPAVHYFTFNEYRATLRVHEAVLDRLGAAPASR